MSFRKSEMKRLHRNDQLADTDMTSINLSTGSSIGKEHFQKYPIRCIHLLEGLTCAITYCWIDDVLSGLVLFYGWPALKVSWRPRPGYLQSCNLCTEVTNTWVDNTKTDSVWETQLLSSSLTHLRIIDDKRHICWQGWWNVLILRPWWNHWCSFMMNCV